ncbi:MAG: transposase [Planctomycetes bacterium]|nr:transposase [Planctomycetota bacterium]
MNSVFSFVITFLMGAFRSRLSLQLEIAALRYQLFVYQRSQRRPAITSSDRLLWSLLARLWRGWRDTLFIVQPRTVIQWQRKRFRDYWRQLSRGLCSGRPTISPELRSLIRRMWQANPTWGSPRIVGELKMLGIDVAKSTVEKYRPKLRKPPSPSWRTFLDQHMRHTVAIDFFTVPTVRLRVLFVLIVLTHDRRKIVHFNVTEHPTAEWTAQQLVESFPWERPPKYLLRDRDAIYGNHFRKRVRSLGMKECPIAPRSPWQNPYVERVIGSIRRECLDHIVVLNKRHLTRILRSYFAYYHQWRPHRSLEMNSPDGRSVHPPEMGEIIEFPTVSGLHHTYIRKAA